ncbi:MAG: hypothetical protein AAF430_05985 [Myxococcota bacterium]
MTTSDAERVGLCAACAHAIRQRSAKGQAFWRCRQSDVDPRLLRYPPLPVLACRAHRPGTPEERGER